MGHHGGTEWTEKIQSLGLTTEDTEITEKDLGLGFIKRDKNL